jgi:hypothetical protein
MSAKSGNSNWANDTRPSIAERARSLGTFPYVKPTAAPAGIWP